MTQTTADDSLLFEFAIMESEPFGLPVRDTITWGALPVAFFNDMGCNLSIAEHDYIKFWACLRNATVSDIIAAQNKAENDEIVETGHLLDLFMPWSPTVGTDVFDGQPLFMFQESIDLKAKHNNKDTYKESKNTINNNINNGNNLVRDIAYIIGTVMNEGTEFIYMAYPNGVDREELDETLAMLVGPDVAAGIREHYPLPQNTTDYRNYLSLVATDGLFKCPTRNVTVSHGSNNFKRSIFMYHFDHISSFNSAGWGSNYSECFDVVCHGAELPYVFRPNLGPINSEYKDSEWILAKSIQNYWTQFAVNNGMSPGNGGNEMNVEWQPFGLGSEMSLLLQTDNVQMQGRVDWDDSKCQFWDSTGYSWIK